MKKKRRPISSKPRMTADELRRLYVDEKKGCPEIALIAERDAKTVYWWLKQASIPTRPRGGNLPFKDSKRPVQLGRRHSPETRRKIGLQTAARENKGFMRNGVHFLKTIPREQHPSWKGGATPERQAFYRSDEWKAVCKIVWRRANACCERCGDDYREADRGIERFHVHHIVSFQCRALRAEPGNLALLCSTCHRWVHSAANVKGDFIRPMPALEAAE